jgi:large subunit ribosomal protein L4
MNRKERKLALKSALAYKVIYNNLIILDKLNLETNKTKEALEVLNNLKVDRKILIVVDELNDNIILATRNIKDVILMEAMKLTHMTLLLLII